VRSNDLRYLLALLGAICLASALAAGCPNRAASDETPEGALTIFLAAMNDGDRGRAYDLLDPDAQRVLRERASRASREAGQELAPSEMLAVDRFVLRWDIYRMTSRIEGDEAQVEATGNVEGQRATVDLRRVDGRWRVVLPLDAQ
jgi:hypothetical protein